MNSNNNMMNGETLSMKDLGKIVFPELNEITAERKTSKTFKELCNQLGINPDLFKSSKKYMIPKASLPMWKLLLRNINAVEGNPSKNGYENFITDIIKAKDEVDREFDDINNNDVSLSAFQQSMLTIYETFYTATSHGQSIAMLLHNQLFERIQNDLKYIREKAPSDRIVFYTEFYFKEVNRKAEKMGEYIKKMIDEKWHEQ